MTTTRGRLGAEVQRYFVHCTQVLSAPLRSAALKEEAVSGGRLLFGHRMQQESAPVSASSNTAALKEHASSDDDQNYHYADHLTEHFTMNSDSLENNDSYATDDSNHDSDLACDDSTAVGSRSTTASSSETLESLESFLVGLHNSHSSSAKSNTGAQNSCLSSSSVRSHIVIVCSLTKLKAASYNT
eukprot:18078-Heterococcus_DN1.PRE.1